MTKAKHPRRKPSNIRRLWSVVENLGLVECKRCWHFHHAGHVCYECMFDNSLTAEEQATE